MYCEWRGENKLMIDYHDNVYGVIKKDTNLLLKWLVLEQAQAGLSWQTIVNRETAYDEFFYNFDIEKISRMDYDKEVIRMQDSQIIKNKLKLKAIINDALIIKEIEKEISFFDYLISLINVNNDIDTNVNNIVIQFKCKGFKFVGYEIIKSYYESVGIINNHQKNCRCYTKPFYNLNDNM